MPPKGTKGVKKNGGFGSPLKTKAERSAQAASMVKARVDGLTLQQIAKNHNVHPNTVKNRLKWAEQEGMVAEFRDQILSQVVPKAIKTYEKALTGKGLPKEQSLQLDAARDITFGTGILRKETKASQQVDVEMTLAAYRERRQEKAIEGEVVTRNDPDPSPVSDGTIFVGGSDVGNIPPVNGDV